MKKFLVLFSIFLIVSSCNNSVVEKPDNLIDDDTMVDILYDLSIIDVIKSQGSFSGKNYYSNNDYIFKKYKIDSLQFARSNQYYASDVAKYKRMYNKVNQRLTDNDAELTEKMLQNNEKQVAPSNNGAGLGQIK
jgi:Domain of unknown function (DUF4296)